jgi:hypothetical protein
LAAVTIALGLMASRCWADGHEPSTPEVRPEDPRTRVADVEARFPITIAPLFCNALVKISNASEAYLSGEDNVISVNQSPNVGDDTTRLGASGGAP